MKTLSRLLVFLVIAVILGGVAFLAAWDIPPPSATTEKVIPNDRFPQ